MTDADLVATVRAMAAEMAECVGTYYEVIVHDQPRQLAALCDALEGQQAEADGWASKAHSVGLPTDAEEAMDAVNALRAQVAAQQATIARLREALEGAVRVLHLTAPADLEAVARAEAALKETP